MNDNRAKLDSGAKLTGNLYVVWSDSEGQLMRYAPAHQLEAVQRLCNTGSVRSGATDPRTDAMPLELLSAAGRDRIKSCVSSYLRDNARMAKSADAADLKSAGRKAVGVQVPLWAPSRSSSLRETISRPTT
jgi:hypothetical protein